MIRPDEVAQAILAILSLQSLYALFLFPLIWGMVKCCWGKYPRWQHGLWLLILLRLVLSPDMATPWSASHLIRSLTSHTVSRQYLAFPYEFRILQDHQKPISTPIPDNFMPDGPNPHGVVPTIGSKLATVPSPPLLKRISIVTSCTYFAVVTLLLVRFLRTRRRYWKIAWQGKTFQDPAVLDIVRDWRRRLHIRRAIEVKAVVSDVPTYTMGLFRPVIILPEHLICSSGSAALESVLAHELVHVKRWDDLAICLQELVKIVYFFHPVVWFVMPRLTWTREAVCDGTVLSHGTLSPRTYGKQLIAFDRDQGFPEQSPKALAVFTSAARGMAFRLNHIQKEDNMKSNPLLVYLTVLVLGLFLLPMAPVASSNQGNTTDDIQVSRVQDRDSHQMANNALTQYILKCVPCQNPKEVSRIIWGDRVTEDFKEEDFSRLVSATDCDIVENIGDGQKAYVFYLLSSSRNGVYRPNFHFIMKQNKLKLLFKSRNLSGYVTDCSKVNGRYEIEEGWRADLFDGINDDRVNLAWGSTVWFWSGTQYLKAYTDYTIQEATNPSLLGTKREWEKDNRSVYEAAPRK
ncbi:M56 family metallopeptidase [Desulfosarcina sp.]|uniref:M56 family metallopeptidase n=1 Tax=Desulfosarcina sp. TaxID=2027861 RepID=UPI0029A8C70A|nr:M56 family metallopeptidase [Desulfosarcina sp.]MDX2454072.1 M56 family metallopeptidase [Desulfosarcina sp.]MDX2491759.1 M56 family metallopeptidase [Desulfosarcina sp.]